MSSNGKESRNVTTHILYDTMTSMTYLSTVFAAILLLTLILLIILITWCIWLKWSKNKYKQKTVHYTPLHSDDEEERKSKAKPKPTRRLLFSDYHRVPQTSHTKTTQHRSSRSTTVSSVNSTIHVDINAGHLLIAYMEDNKDRFDKEWQSLTVYKPDDVTTSVGMLLSNKHKNRYPDLLPYDHRRVKLVMSNNEIQSDYINASYIVDTDPNFPKYIATQGPMQHTVNDFWQMVWEQNITVIVMLTPLSDLGLTQSCQYWPTSGVSKYHLYEVRLVSEHRHTEHYIVRSFYIVNLKTNITRTVTQFHYLTWSSTTVPQSATPLLEFRRKVTLAHPSYSTLPLLVHCSDGIGRTGTYILIDMTLSRICSGAKEINLAATIEHLRDQRINMVKSKQQFDFALSALVEETQDMLNSAAQSH